MRRHGKPRKGNAYALSLDLHVFPKRSIFRFATRNGKQDCVDAQLKFRGMRWNYHPSDVLFCANRAWSHTAEKDITAIEDKFQPLADRIIDDKRAPTGLEHDIITEFYVSWTLRHCLRKNPLKDQYPHGYRIPDRDLEEKLETQPGGFFINGEGVLAGRLFAGSLLKINTEITCENLAGTHWGVLESHSAHEEFIVPDNFMSYGIVPLAPNLLLVAGAESGTIGAYDVRLYNTLAIKAADRYYFSRDLSKCPFSYGETFISAPRLATDALTTFRPHSLIDRFELFPSHL